MNRVLISRHVIFDELSSPFASSGPPLNDLDSLFSSSPTVHAIAPPYPSSAAGTSETIAMPRVAPVSMTTLRMAPAPTPARHRRHRRIIVCATPVLGFTLHPSPLVCQRWHPAPALEPPLPMSGHQSTTSSSWLVTPATPT
jgi:hypothetical protein